METVEAYLRFTTINLKAASDEPVPVRGNCVRLVSSNVPVNFKNENGNINFTLQKGEQAYFENGIFTRLTLSHESPADELVTLSVSAGAEIGSSQVSGDVTISNRGAATQNRVSLTNVNQQILAANANRKYLLIQNNDVSAIMRVKIDGAAATVAQGFKIPAGASLELNGFQATSAINAIMETATAAVGNVEFAEG